MSSLRYISRATLIAAVVYGTSSIAATTTPVAGWFVGVGVGQSTIKDNYSYTNINVNRDTHDTGHKLFAGYRFNNHFAIESSYVNLGKEKSTWRYAANEYGSDSLAADAFTVAASGRLPLNNAFSLIGKAGVAAMQLKYRETWVQDNIETNVSENKRSTVPLLGLGAEYLLQRGLTLRAEYEHFGKAKLDDDIKVDSNLLSISLGYQF